MTSPTPEPAPVERGRQALGELGDAFRALAASMVRWYECNRWLLETSDRRRHNRARRKAVRAVLRGLAP